MNRKILLIDILKEVMERHGDVLFAYLYGSYVCNSKKNNWGQSLTLDNRMEKGIGLRTESIRVLW
jgi:hypothetical protein